MLGLTCPSYASGVSMYYLHGCKDAQNATLTMFMVVMQVDISLEYYPLLNVKVSKAKVSFMPHGIFQPLPLLSTCILFFI